jgi:hypothetical protein
MRKMSVTPGKDDRLTESEYTHTQTPASYIVTRALRAWWLNRFMAKTARERPFLVDDVGCVGLCPAWHPLSV